MKRLPSQGWLSGVTLFTSVGTLICCALPALLVTLGAGAALAGLVTAVPQLVWLSEHKKAVFLISGLMIALAGFMRYQTRNAPCPIDPHQAQTCARMRKISGVIYAVSVAVYAVGFFFAFLAVRVFYPG